MNPGKLDKKIVIQKCNKTVNSEGVSEMIWTDLRTIFASIEDKIVRNVCEDNSVITQVETNMVVRNNYKTLFASDTRIVYQERKYSILDISEIDDNYIKIITKGEKLYNVSST